MSNAAEHLTVWEKPDDYAGYSPDGDFVVMAINRDSTILDQSNWHCADAQLIHALMGVPDVTDGGNEWLYTWRASHWACGWVEYMMIRKDAPEGLIEAASEIVCALADYPILDEDHYLDLQCEEIAQYWERISMRERVDWCQGAGITCFAARSDIVPEVVWDEMYQSDLFI